MSDIASTHSPSRELELAVDRLLREARDARAGAIVLDSCPDESSASYADAVTTTLASMELDLKIARAALEARRSEHPDFLQQAVRDVADAGRAWLDDVAVQSALARMDLRDLSVETSRRLAHATNAAEQASGAVGDSLRDLRALREAAFDSMRDLRRALADAISAVADSLA